MYILISSQPVVNNESRTVVFNSEDIIGDEAGVVLRRRGVEEKGVERARASPAFLQLWSTTRVSRLSE